MLKWRGVYSPVASDSETMVQFESWIFALDALTMFDHTSNSPLTIRIHFSHLLICDHASDQFVIYIGNEIIVEFCVLTIIPNFANTIVKALGYIFLRIALQNNNLHR